MTSAAAGPLGWRAAVLPVLLLALYAPVLGFGFLDLDDGSYLTLNPHVANGLTWESFRWALSSTYFGWWHPVTWWSHLLDVSLFGWNPSGHHATSAVLHAANALLAVVLLYRLGTSVGVALTASALVFLHPTRVESVAWLSERKDVLFVFFGLVALLAWVRYRERPSAGRYALLAVALAAGLASKAMLVTFPVLLLIVESWRSRRGTVQWKRLLLEVAPLVLLSIAAGLAIVGTQSAGGALPNLTEFSLAQRLERVPFAYLHYLKTSLWPIDLCAYYPAPAFGQAQALLLALICAALAAALIIFRRKVPHLAHGAAWFAVALAPVTGVLQAGGAFAADRYLYWPQLGLFTAVVLSIPVAVRQRAIARFGAVAISLGLAALTAFQLPVWRDSETLFRSTLEISPHNPFMQTSLGLLLLKQGRAPEALAPLATAAPVYPYGQSIQGLALIETGAEEEGERALRAAAQRGPSDRQLIQNVALGFIKLAQRALVAGKREDAFAHLEEALRYDPTSSAAQRLKAELLEPRR